MNIDFDAIRQHIYEYAGLVADFLIDVVDHVEAAFNEPATH